MIKYILSTVAFLFFTSFSVPESSTYTEECDIEAFYDSLEIPDGSKAIDDYDNLIEISNVLIKNDKIEEGRYSTSISRISSNLYKVDGKDLYIETSLCLELAYYTNVIIIVEGYQGYKLGKVLFTE